MKKLYTAAFVAMALLLVVSDVWSLRITCPAQLAWGDLRIGSNVSQAQPVTATSEMDYTIYIRADKLRMSEYQLDTRTYTGDRELTQPLEWSVDGQNYETVTTKDKIAQWRLPYTPSSGRVTPFYFRQKIVYGDQRLEPGRVYRINIYYTLIQLL